MKRDLTMELADGFTLVAAYKLLAGCLGVIEQPATFGAWAFVAGAAAVATILFVDCYIWERTR